MKVRKQYMRLMRISDPGVLFYELSDLVSHAFREHGPIYGFVDVTTFDGETFCSSSRTHTGKSNPELAAVREVLLRVLRHNQPKRTKP